MVRPLKQGVDYFPLDVYLDDKVKFVEIKYKLEGFAIVIKIFQRIYSQGYWCKWTEDEALLFSDEIKADFELVQNVVFECVKRGVFDQDLFENHDILTSKGIQKRYKEIVRRRKDVEVITEYLLIDDNLGVNDGNNSINDDIKPTEGKRNDGKSTQRKGNRKETKKKTDKEIKNSYAEFVYLTEKEYNKLVEEHGEANTLKMIQVLDNYKGANNKKYASDYRAILTWVVERVKNDPKINVGTHKKQNQFTQEDLMF